HRCSGCGLRWEGDLSVVELCGDCWRKVQPEASRGPQEQDLRELSTCEGCGDQGVNTRRTDDDVWLCPECFAEVPVIKEKNHERKSEGLAVTGSGVADQRSRSGDNLVLSHATRQQIEPEASRSPVEPLDLAFAQEIARRFTIPGHSVAVVRAEDVLPIVHK